jgi:hypothetical protein
MNNKFVKMQQEKYGNDKAHGRPKKRSIHSNAERRVKDTVGFKISSNDTSYCFF